MNYSIIDTLIDYKNTLAEALKNLSLEEVAIVIELLRQIKMNKKNIFVIGNGGSALTASHLASDLNKGASYNKQERFRVTCLCDNIATIMAYANDVDYTQIFVEQLKNFLQPKDMVIGISGSGNSVNVINAFEYANSIGASTVALVGFDGGKLKQIAQYTIHIPINDMQISEDLHLVIVHMLMRALQ
jgi:D-sedoheptulose 7-phosphate isomerase